jgi:hypothetical protein
MQTADNNAGLADLRVVGKHCRLSWDLLFAAVAVRQVNAIVFARAA